MVPCQAVFNAEDGNFHASQPLLKIMARIKLEQISCCSGLGSKELLVILHCIWNIGPAAFIL
jgi:uncharacterized protein (DUF39 family)